MDPERSQRGCILVVEDESLIRILAVDLFEEAGYTTFEAEETRTALTILATIERPAVLFTDIDLSDGTNGLELAAECHDRFPDIPIVITSGIQRPSADDLPPRVVFIPKPYATDAVLSAVERLLP